MKNNLTMDIAMRRWPLLAAGLILALTAAFHLTGLPMARGWVGGMPGRIVSLLWVAPALTWLLIAAYWLWCWLDRRMPEPPAMVLTALIPLVVAVPLLAMISAAHPGGYMLLAASALVLLVRKGES